MLRTASCEPVRKSKKKKKLLWYVQWRHPKIAHRNMPGCNFTPINENPELHVLFLNPELNEKVFDKFSFKKSSKHSKAEAFLKK